MNVESTTNMPIAMQIEGAIMKQNLDGIKADGEATVKMIDNACEALKNNPLPDGPVGTKINIGV